MLISRCLSSSPTRPLSHFSFALASRGRGRAGNGEAVGSGEASGEGERGTYIENGERGSWRGEKPSTLEISREAVEEKAKSGPGKRSVYATVNSLIRIHM